MASGSARGQVVLIRKPTTQWDQPLTVRTLTILAVLYRTWAAVRLEDLSPWVQRWATAGMFAVVEGTDAAMGAYRSAVIRECATLRGVPFSGCCDDVWKAYDMICRATAVLVALMAGFPKQLATAYLRFHDAVEVRTALALGLGRPRRRQLSIPQGVPLEQRLLGIAHEAPVGPPEGASSDPSAAGVGTAGMQSAGSIADLLAQGGAARAGAKLGSASAWQQSLNLPAQFAGLAIGRGY